MEATILFLASIWIAFLEGAQATYYCYNSYYSITYRCDYGCCGSSSTRTCCDYEYEYTDLTGIIVGAVVGGIVLISVIVVVCIVIMKKKGYGGKVFGRFGGNRSVGVVNHHPPTTTVTTTPGHQGNTYPMGYQQPPPNYNQATVYPQGSAQQPNYPPPPGAMYGDPAYPPEYKQ